MTYKCLDCGHLFEEGEESHFSEEHGESYTGCPICGGAYEDTRPCKHCGADHLEDDLRNGFCIGCILETMTMVNMTRYLEDTNLEADFYIGEFYNSIFDYASPSLVKLARGGFMNHVHSDELLHYGEVGYESPLIESLRKFIVDDGYGLYDFSEWLNSKKEVKK
jgi:DNA-directed RNA polymerase subunit RPC12/RpoP